jgi:hypothetical protein
MHVLSRIQREVKWIQYTSKMNLIDFEVHIGDSNKDYII